MKWLALGLLLLASCQKPVRTSLTVEAYVWQAPDRPEVQQAMKEAAGVISKLHIRAAELKWDGSRFETRRALTNLPSPGCGLVVRIGASASQLEWSPPQIAAVAEVFQGLAKLGPAEIQCDYDCPQKRLGRYRVLLDALQSAVGKVPVLPTTLPSWLDEPEFRKLIAGCPGYVLQVHSLQLPKRSGEPIIIFSPDTAKAAAIKTSAMNVPFRIAMATYGCEVRFDAEGKVTDVISEDSSSAAAAERSFALADPVASARLIREWTNNPPAGLQGIVWYRLPVEGDRRNWPLETLELVSRGEVSESTPAFEATPGTGARDLFVVNHGRFPVKLPGEVIITSPVTAADGAGAYRLDQRPDGLHFLIRAGVWPWLDPGKKIPTGWLRVAGESARIEVSLKP